MGVQEYSKAPRCVKSFIVAVRVSSALAGSKSVRLFDTPPPEGGGFLPHRVLSRVAL